MFSSPANFQPHCTAVVLQAINQQSLLSSQLFSVVNLQELLDLNILQSLGSVCPDTE